MKRDLGQVLNVERAYWDWRKQIGWVRFEEGETADRESLAEAFDRFTMYTAGEITYLRRVDELPDALR